MSLAVRCQNVHLGAMTPNVSPASCAPCMPTTEGCLEKLPRSTIIRLTVFLPLQRTKCMTDTTRLSSKGQIIIPKRLRSVYQWQPGQEFVVLETEEGILLKARRPFPTTDLDEVAGSLPFEGPSKSLEEMADAIRKGVAEQTGAEPADADHGASS